MHTKVLIFLFLHIWEQLLQMFRTMLQSCFAVKLQKHHLTIHKQHKHVKFHFPNLRSHQPQPQPNPSNFSIQSSNNASAVELLM